MSKHNFSVVIEKDKYGYVAKCPSIQGCYTQGKTYEEVIRKIKEVIALCLEDMSPKEEKELVHNLDSLTLTAVEV